MQYEASFVVVVVVVVLFFCIATLFVMATIRRLKKRTIILCFSQIRLYVMKQEKAELQKIIFLISQQKHMLRLLIRAVSTRRF